MKPAKEAKTKTEEECNGECNCETFAQRIVFHGFTYDQEEAMIRVIDKHLGFGGFSPVFDPMERNLNEAQEDEPETFAEVFQEGLADTEEEHEEATDAGRN